MGIEDREDAMKQLESCRIEVLPKAQEGEVAVSLIADCSLLYWNDASGRLNGDKVISQLDNAFYDTIVEEQHTKLCTFASNFHLPFTVDYVTDSAKAPMPKIRRKAVRVLPQTARRQLNDASRPTILSEEVTRQIRHDESTILPYLFEHKIEEGLNEPDPTDKEAILFEVQFRGLLPVKTMNALRASFSLTSLCAALNKDNPETHPWKRCTTDTSFRRNQIGRCNERLYGKIMAGSAPHATLHGMFHEYVSNDDGIRRLLRPDELGEADHIMSNLTMDPTKIIVLVTTDSDQITLFLLRHTHFKNTVIWYENMREGRLYNLTLLRQQLTEEESKRRALSYILAGTDFVHAKVLGSSLKLQELMKTFSNFSLTDAWSDPVALKKCISRVMTVGESSRRKKLTRADGTEIDFSGPGDVANNLFYHSGELFRLFTISNE